MLWRGAARVQAHAKARHRADREGQGLLPKGPDPTVRTRPAGGPRADQASPRPPVL